MGTKDEMDDDFDMTGDDGPTTNVSTPHPIPAPIKRESFSQQSDKEEDIIYTLQAFYATLALQAHYHTKVHVFPGLQKDQYETIGYAKRPQELRYITVSEKPPVFILPSIELYELNERNRRTATETAMRFIVNDYNNTHPPHKITLEQAGFAGIVQVKGRLQSIGLSSTGHAITYAKAPGQQIEYLQEGDPRELMGGPQEFFDDEKCGIYSACMVADMTAQMASGRKLDTRQCIQNAQQHLGQAELVTVADADAFIAARANRPQTLTEDLKKTSQNAVRQLGKRFNRSKGEGFINAWRRGKDTAEVQAAQRWKSLLEIRLNKRDYFKNVSDFNRWCTAESKKPVMQQGGDSGPLGAMPSSMAAELRACFARHPEVVPTKQEQQQAIIDFVLYSEHSLPKSLQGLREQMQGKAEALQVQALEDFAGKLGTVEPSMGRSQATQELYEALSAKDWAEAAKVVESESENIRAQWSFSTPKKLR